MGTECVICITLEVHGLDKKGSCPERRR